MRHQFAMNIYVLLLKNAIFLGMTSLFALKVFVGLSCLLAKPLAGLPQEELPDDQFWIPLDLEDINWTKIFNDETPFLNDTERDIIFTDSFDESVNPLVIISILVTENKSHGDTYHQTVPQFASVVEGMARSLVDSYGKYEESTANVETNAATSAIWYMLDSNDDKLKSFLETYNRLYSEHIKPFEIDFNEEDRTDRDPFILNWPWPNGKSWRVGGTHSRSWSSLDFSDGITKCSWSRDQDCIVATPLVYSMHSGTVRSVSKCNIVIIHSSGWATQYYHMDDIKFKNGDYVKASQAIGRYAGDYKTALCDAGRTTGPHLHLSLKKIVNGKSLRPQTLDGWLISGYKVKAGVEAYDKNCERCNFQKDGRTYCPKGHSIPRDDTHHRCDSNSDCETGLPCIEGYCKECALQRPCANGEYCTETNKCKETCCGMEQHRGKYTP